MALEVLGRSILPLACSLVDEDVVDRAGNCPDSTNALGDHHHITRSQINLAPIRENDSCLAAVDKERDRSVSRQGSGSRSIPKA